MYICIDVYKIDDGHMEFFQTVVHVNKRVKPWMVVFPARNCEDRGDV